VSTLSPREFQWLLIQSNTINLAIVLLFPMPVMLVYAMGEFGLDWKRLYNGFWEASALFISFAVTPHFLHTFVVDSLVSAFGQPSRRKVLVALSINMAVVLAILSLFACGSVNVLILAILYGLALGYGQYLRWRYVCCLLDRASADNLPGIYRVVERTYLIFTGNVIFVFIFYALK